MEAEKEVHGMSGSAPAGKPRILIIGLDGATYATLGPFMDTGKLPTLERLSRGGVHGPLYSTICPVTAPAWTSFMTGKNPGKHGLYNFIEPKPDSYDLRYTNARSRRAATVFEMLNQSGLRVGVINVPMTYPPDPVDGYLISGMDAPESSREITHPPELYAELEERLGRVGQQIRHLGSIASDQQREALLQDLAAMDEHYRRLTRHLLETRPVDVVMLVFTSTDTVQHFFHQYLDPHHPHHDPEGAKRFGDAIFQVYQRLDGIIADLVGQLPGDASVVLLSDHGFKSTSGIELHLTRFLEELGLQRRRPKGMLSRLAGALQKRADSLLRSRLSYRQKARIAELLPALRQKWEASFSGLSDIDWASSRAYCYELLSVPPGIFINVKGLRPQGMVEPGAEYQELVKLLTEKLYEIKDPRTGRQLIERVYHKDEIYSGPFRDQAPDLTVSWWAGPGFVTRPGVADRPVVEDNGNRPLAAGEWGGNHAIDGILALYGPHFRSGLRLEAPSLMDVTPTLMHLLDQPIPEDLDGRVLLEAFTEEHTAKHPVRTRPPFDLGPRGDGSGPTYSDEESRQMEERLRGLGYIG
jgi:predicted AlkP superfamily phosphohydrolase/phosphomutase